MATLMMIITLASALLRQLKQDIREREVVEGFQVAPQAPLAHTCITMVSEQKYFSNGTVLCYSVDITKFNKKWNELNENTKKKKSRQTNKRKR